MKVPRGRLWTAVGALAIATPVAAQAAAAGAAEVVAALHAQDVAVATAGYRLAVGAAALCRPGRASGVLLQRLSLYAVAYRDAARHDVGIGDRPTVAVVVPGSAAALAGIRQGDALVAAGDTRFEAVPALRGDADVAPTAADRRSFDAALADGAAALTLLRDGAPVRVTLRAAPACPARFDVRTGRAMNAYSDGTTVLVDGGLVNLAQGEGELAAIVAHELAHNILNHPARLEAARHGGARLAVRRTEVEADRLSVYLLVRAGYDPAAAIAFWNRFSRARGAGLLPDPHHPGWRERVAILAREAAAIAAMRARGAPVVPPPDLRAPPDQAASAAK